jgi:acyl-coenzyme A thioesterase PaaI-like protein
MDIHVNFLKAVYAGENAVIKAKVTHAGKRIINTISELYVEDKLCATADAIFYNLN